MKKTILAIILMALFTIPSYAQGPCDCVEDSTERQVFKNLCPYIGYDGIPQNPINNPDALWILIKYTQVTCGTQVTIRVNSIHISNAYENYTNLGYTQTNTCPFPYTIPPPIGNAQAYQAWTLNLLDELLPKSDPNGRKVLFSAGCMSQIRVQWPAGSVIYIPNGDGGGYTPFSLNTSSSNLMFAPCLGEGCCKMKLLNDGSGATTSPDEELNCSSSVIDPAFVPTISTIDPSGATITYTGTIIGQEPCQTMCPVLIKFFTTNIGKPGAKIPLEFSSNPTLVGDYIKLESSAKISHVELYDVLGKKVQIKQPENGEISTSNLKEGTYYLQVHFTDKQVKTVKIYKQ